MAEYSDYDDSIYDELDHVGKAKKFRSWIPTILSVLFLTSVVIFVIVRMPKTVRTKFDTVTSSEHIVGENGDYNKNEFYKLKSMLDNDETFTVDDKFKEEYPNVYKLIKSSKKDIAQNTVYSFDDDNILTIAQVYIISEDSTAQTSKDDHSVTGNVCVDVVNVKYSSTNDGQITLENPDRFSISYMSSQNAGVNTLSSHYVKSDSFRLNFYTLSVKLISAKKDNYKSVNMTLTLSDAITKEEAENNTFGKAVTLVGSDGKSDKTISGGERGDNSIEKQLISGDLTTSATVKIFFDDVMYRKFDNISVKANKSDRFAISIN